MDVKIHAPADIKVQVRNPNPDDLRFVVAASLGCHVVGVAQPHPDMACPKTQLAGAVHRFCRPMPEPDPALLAEWRQFCRDTSAELFTKASPDDVFSFETWLDGTSYTSSMKETLRLEKARMEEAGGYFAHTSKRNENADVHMFTKDEAYPEYKHSRCINGRVNATKVLMGPVFKLIEKIVFAHPAFIKKIPVADRPKYMSEHMEGPGTVQDTDFVSLEATFRLAIMIAEVEFYLWVLQDREEYADARRFLKEVLLGLNRCEGKWITLWVEVKRMSGENNTSLGNGWFNLMVNLFGYHKIDIDWRVIKQVLEGDDGKHRSPTGQHPDEAFFRRLGASIKCAVVESINEASFCGLVFDEVECINIADPRKVLADFGLTSRDYAGSSDSVLKGLLRSKALSVAYQYPNAPIFSALARYGLRVTTGSDTSALKFVLRSRPYKWSDLDRKRWEKDGFRTIRDLRLQLNLGSPGPRTRLLMEKLFGVSCEQQVAIEEYLDSLVGRVPLVLPIEFPADWYDYAARFGTYYEKSANRVPFQPQDVRHLDMRDYVRHLTGDIDYYV